MPYRPLIDLIQTIGALDNLGDLIGKEVIVFKRAPDDQRTEKEDPTTFVWLEPESEKCK